MSLPVPAQHPLQDEEGPSEEHCKSGEYCKSSNDLHGSFGKRGALRSLCGLKDLVSIYKDDAGWFATLVDLERRGHEVLHQASVVRV